MLDPKPKSAITHNEDFDWCHLCGRWSKQIANIWYPANAVNDPPVDPGPPSPDRRYLRICGKCGKRISRAASNTPTPVPRSGGE